MTPIYTRAADLPEAPFPYVAVDTETTRFTEPTYDLKRRTRLTPFEHPRLVTGQLAYNNKLEVYRHEHFVPALARLIEQGFSLVFHNVSFDYHVLNRYAPDLGRVLRAAVNEGRVYDTLSLEQLIQIARGNQTTGGKTIGPEPLHALAERRAGMCLAKEGDIRLGFDQFEPIGTTIPGQYLEYAAKDAEATARVFVPQLKEALFHATNTVSRYPVLPNAGRRFGPLSSHVQVKGAIALAWMERGGLRVDNERLELLRRKFSADADRLASALVGFGLASRTKRGLSIAQKRIRAALAEYARASGFTPEFTDTGLVSLEYEFWRDYIPRITPELEQSPSAASTFEQQASVWMRFQRLRKDINTYLDVYGSGERHYPSYYLLGARTGRVSCVRPNAQQIPKHGPSGGFIRSLFIPTDGYSLIEGDFKSAELVALAEIYHAMYGGSQLEDCLNEGRDYLMEGAATVFSNEWAAADKLRRDKLRQVFKIGAYGIPGGLGRVAFARKLRAKAEARLSDEEAGRLRRQIIDSDPALHDYLSEDDSETKLRLCAINLGISYADLIEHLDAWIPGTGDPHIGIAISRLNGWIRDRDDRYSPPTPPGFDKAWDCFKCPTRTLTGRIRGRAAFGAAHNTPFQGLVSDGFKLAAWNLYQRAEDTDVSWRCLAGIHDSILIEAPPHQYQEAAAALDACMVAGLREVCPNINCRVELSDALERWAPAKDLSPAT